MTEKSTCYCNIYQQGTSAVSLRQNKAISNELWILIQRAGHDDKYFANFISRNTGKADVNKLSNRVTRTIQYYTQLDFKHSESGKMRPCTQNALK